MSWLSLFGDEVKAVVGAALPAVDGRLFDTVQTSRQNLLQAITAPSAGGGIDLPLAIVQVGRAIRDDARGLDNRSYRVPTTITILIPVSDTMIADAEAMIEALALAIERTKHTTFQAIEDGEPDAQETNAAIRALLDARMNVYAATLTYRPGLLTGDYAL